MLPGLGCAGLLALWLALGSDEVQKGNADGRILPREVTLENLDAFEKQLLRDLPVGTTKQDVETYLKRWEISYTYLPPDSGWLEYSNSFYATLDNIGSRNFLRASLSISIVHDEEDKVRAIWFSVKYK
ncbi:hypothetical protein AAFN88_00285 [Pelagibius sp. CAU 1746]|uniref:hypothetical protein n=1 Tax=Pelagibius sp. CAU 1746 TaxID=3140370 RepID=UPI00325C13CC